MAETIKNKQLIYGILSHCQALQKVSKLEAENQSIEQVRIFPLFLNHLLGVSWQVLSCKLLLFFFSLQLKEQMMLLEAQLEKQTDSHLISEEMEQVYKQLRSTADLLELYYMYIK